MYLSHRPRRTLQTMFRRKAQENTGKYLLMVKYHLFHTNSEWMTWQQSYLYWWRQNKSGYHSENNLSSHIWLKPCITEVFVSYIRGMIFTYIIAKSHTFQELKKWKIQNCFCDWYNFSFLMRDWFNDHLIIKSYTGLKRKLCLLSA